MPRARGPGKTEEDGMQMQAKRAHVNWFNLMDEVERAAKTMARLAYTEEEDIPVEIAELVAEKSAFWLAEIECRQSERAAEDFRWPDKRGYDFESDVTDAKVLLGQMNAVALMIAMGRSDHTDKDRYEVPDKSWWLSGLTRCATEMRQYADVGERFAAYMDGEERDGFTEAVEAEEQDRPAFGGLMSLEQGARRLVRAGTASFHEIVGGSLPEDDDTDNLESLAVVAARQFRSAIAEMFDPPKGDSRDRTAAEDVLAQAADISEIIALTCIALRDPDAGDDTQRHAWNGVHLLSDLLTQIGAGHTVGYTEGGI